MSGIAQIDKIESRIFQIRGKRVMLDKDLAILYEVETRILVQAVKRNLRRFPDDFMFRLTAEEAAIWRSQIVISKNWGRRRYLPYAFTQEGVAMLSGILNSERAIFVNIQIMRAFVNLRRVALTYTGLKRKIDDMEKKYNAQFGIVFEAIRELLKPPPEQPKRRIGFHP